MLDKMKQPADPTPRDTYMDMVPKVDRYLRLKYKDIDQVGLEYIQDGSAMYVANHLRFDDSLAIAAVYAKATGRPLRLGAKSEYFEGEGITKYHILGERTKRFVEDTGQLPVYREDNARGAVQLDRAIKERFERGESVLLHAEGTRSIDGRLNKLKSGAARFAIKNSVSIIPVAVTYGRKKPYHLRESLKVEFGEPLTPELYGMDFSHPSLLPGKFVDAIAPRLMNPKERAAKVTGILEARIAAMSGQERSGYFLNPYTKQLEVPDDMAA